LEPGDNDDKNDNDAQLDSARLDDNSPTAADLCHTVIVVLLAAFLLQQLRGQVRQGISMLDTTHIDEGGLGIESNNQQLWGQSVASGAEAEGSTTDTTPLAAQRSCSLHPQAPH